MRLTVAVALSCAAIGFVGADPTEQADPPKHDAKQNAEPNRIAANPAHDQSNRKPSMSLHLERLITYENQLGCEHCAETISHESHETDGF